jgi:molecular chaperone DnaK
VTFDVDANGILNVSARDRDTGAEQTISITESGTLDEAEVQRMVEEATRNRDEDQRLRQQIDARNELDSVAYQVERLLGEVGDRAPSNEVARARMLVDEARQAVKEDAPLERIRTLTSDLQQMLQSLSSAAAAAGAGAPGGGPGAPAGAGQPGGATAGAPAGAAGSDEVIDADFTTG